MSGIPHRRQRLLPLPFIISSIFGVTATNSVSALTLLVTECDDGSGSGTLRNTIASAPDSSTVEIPLMCSKITLDQGRIYIPPTITNLYIVGQSASETIIEGPAHIPSIPMGRLFVGAQSGTLGFGQLTLQKGVYSGTDHAVGGCVYSQHSVAFNHAVVTGCLLNPNGNSLYSRGGAIYSFTSVTLLDSEVSNSRAYAAPGRNSSEGGGVFAGGEFYAKSSTISGNSALSGFGGPASQGGGFFSLFGSTVLTRSTISNNEADMNSAGVAQPEAGASLTISSSTIANNHAFASQTLGSYVTTTITNSTIAENTAAIGGTGGGTAGLFSSEAITMYNSIFANNVAATGFSGDVYSVVGLIGDHNLITASSNSVPFKTITNCPKLGHLSSNGGLTQTIPLLSGSPAIDVGAANGQTTDQRGTGFPRTVGSGTDIGAYERQASVVDDVIFFSEFESRCD